MTVKEFFFWLTPLKVIFYDTFWWVFVLILVFALPVIRTWWWVFAPLILLSPLIRFYLWWIRWEVFYKRKDWIVLQVRPPQENMAPYKAMEDIFSVVWSVYDSPNWREIWCEGEFPSFPEWLSFETASKEGKVCFYIRCISGHREVIESAIYSHYPDAEITETIDYTEDLPKNIPNEEWTIYGSDFQYAGKEDFFPIKTYKDFFEEHEQTKEEKRVDPMASMIEAMARLDKGEHFWFQIILVPITENDVSVISKAEEKINEITKRKTKKLKPLSTEIKDDFSLLAGGVSEDISSLTSRPKEEARFDNETMDKEMLLTPGEREVVTAIENKIKKPLFKTSIRGIYLSRKKSYNGSHKKIAESYFSHFQTRNLNYISLLPATRTKIHFFMRGRRNYVRERKMIRKYIDRFPPSFPELNGAGNMLMNTEELATIWHFPTHLSISLVSSVEKVESKKGGPPSELPVEE